MPISLRDYQIKLKSDIYDAWQSQHKNVLAVMPTGLGKCLGENTPVLMFDGSIKKVQDIVVGDLLMGPDSKPKTVLSTCKGESELFRITPVKGDSWVCNDVHVLTLKHCSTDAVIDIPLDQYIKQTNNFKHLYKQFRVGVNFEPQNVPFDPYLVGLYLAEGSYSAAHITSPELEVVKYVNDWAKNNDMKTSIQRGSGCFEIGISEVKPGWYKNKIHKLKDSCTSRDDRWIPREYLVNSREVRLQVLAGLLDGDGYLNDKGFEIITKYDSLNRDILFLARSLGFAAYSKIKIGKIKSTGFEGRYYRINISGLTNEIPNRIPRKKAEPRLQIKDVQNTGFDIKSEGRGQYFGFELDGDGRFLLGDFTVTHNTKSFVSIAIDMALDPNGPRHPTAILVHRKELVQQICLTLAEEGVVHNIIAQRNTIQGIVAAQRIEFKKQFYHYNAPITVISVDTLNARIQTHEKWAKSIKFWIIDEAAHVLAKNKWGQAVSYFTNAVGLGVTATPERLDKRGLGRHADGVFDVMVQGPNSRWGIDNGYLSKYKIAVPLSDYRDHLKKAGSNSDFSKEAMTLASTRSHIIGDVVKNYRKFADGKQAILFATDIQTAQKMENNFKTDGIKAKLLTGDTDDKVRLNTLIEFREKKIQVLLNVDLFDEGLDVPGIECVIMARPTMSLGKFLQMIGRGLRPAKNKPHLILIDHVGNVQQHGLPCTPRQWTLDRIVKRRDKTNLVRVCQNWECNSPYDRLLTECPYCGWELPKLKAGESGSGRAALEQVDGDLELLDPETIRQMERSVFLEDPAKVAERVSMAAGGAAGLKAMKDQAARIEAQKKLAQVIAVWAGKARKMGFTDRQIHKKFFIDFDYTITGALSEPRVLMEEMIDRVKEARL